jgi:PAS domain S-box-containing protein
MRSSEGMGTVLILALVVLLIGSVLAWRRERRNAERLRIVQQQLDQRTQELREVRDLLAQEAVGRRAVEERVQEREAQVRAILDAAPFPMVVSSFPDGLILYLNQPAAHMLDLMPEEAIGQMTANFYAEPAERSALVAQLHQSGAVLGAELRIRTQAQDVRWVLLSAVRFTYCGQDCALVCLNDITTRKQLEDVLRQTNLRSEAALEAERQALREQRNFLGMVSHEFRVPLAIIEAASQLLGIYLRTNPEAEDEVGKIRRAVRRMSELIDVCLADDRLDATSLQLQMGTMDAVGVIAEICEDKRSLAGDRDIILLAPEQAMLVADQTLMRIVFSNLIDNALKFSPPDSPVTIRIQVTSQVVRITISDCGPGIPAEEQARIFEKFYRSTKSDRVRGAGLGLYIVRRIVDLHAGSIAVDSLRGRGTAFTIQLPAITKK